MNKYITLVLIASYAFTPSTTLPQGAPESVCDSMTPFHDGGIEPQRTKAPFRIVPEQLHVNEGNMLRISIDAIAPELKYGGFMIHARNLAPPYQVVSDSTNASNSQNSRALISILSISLQLGRFALSADGLVKLINCQGIETTATHSGTTPKGELSLEWQAPLDFNGDVQFRATVAQTYNAFWVGILSEPVRVHPRNAQLPSSPGISTTRSPIQSTVPSFQPDTQRPVSPCIPIDTIKCEIYM